MLPDILLFLFAFFLLSLFTSGAPGLILVVRRKPLRTFIVGRFTHPECLDVLVESSLFATNL